MQAVEASSEARIRSNVQDATQAAGATVAAVALLDVRRHPELLPQWQHIPFEDAGALSVNGTPVLLTGLFRLHFPPSGSFFLAL